jgi:hypothetical protein
MGTALYIVWGVALLVIVALGVVLRTTLKRGAPSMMQDAPEPRQFERASDTLLFYREESSVRAAIEGAIIVRIPETAWDEEWSDELLRLEVSTRDPASVTLPAEWADTEISAAYDLQAYRMTEIGTDIKVARFPAPIELVFARERAGSRLRLLIQAERTWVLAPVIQLSVDEYEESDLLPREDSLAVSLTSLGRMCLVRLPGSDVPAG